MTRPTIAVVIPSWSGDVSIVTNSLARQTWQPDEIEVAVKVSPNGRARNVGVSGTTSEVLIFIDDDAALANDDAVERLVQPLMDHADIHITGAARLIPPDASWFEKWVAREVPRIENKVVSQALESNPDPPHFTTEITTTCCAMRRADFEATGGFSETQIRGVDTEFFVRVRRMGYRFLLVPNTWTWHPAPKTLYKLWRKHFLYGLGHGQEVVADPSRGQGLQTRPFVYLLFRTMILVPNIFIPFSYSSADWRPGFKPLKATTSYVSALGFVWGSKFVK